MDKKKTIIFSIILIISLIMVTIGLTYAYYSVSQVQTSANTFSTSCYGITLTGSNNISLTSYPMSDNKGLSSSPYNFVVKNTCDTSTGYKVILNIKNTTNSELLQYINYSFDTSTVSVLSNAQKVTLSSDIVGTNVSASYILDIGSMSGITQKSYDLRVWINEEAGNSIMEKKFEASVMVYAEANITFDTLKSASLTNLIMDGSVEEGNWNGTMDTTQAKYGNSSLKVVGSSAAAENTISNKTALAIDYTHTYYARYEIYHTNATGTVGLYWPIAEPNFFEGQAIGSSNTWNLISAVNNRSSFTSYTSAQMRVDYNNNKATTTVWFDGVMIIDLTAAFGSGNEPTKEWCDANIPFFSGSKIIHYTN